MRKKFFNFCPTHCRCIGFVFVLIMSLNMWGQTDTNKTIIELTNLGFENIRCVETEEECIYTIEDNVYKAQGVGISKALDIIQQHGLPINKRCKIIVTHLEIPELSLTYEPSKSDTTNINRTHDWKTSYTIDDSWGIIKNEETKNSSRYKVDILIYPQLSYKNLIITQIYQALFTLNPAIEVSCWPGMKLTGQLIVPIYNDGYSIFQNKIHPGFMTLSQRFRLPYNIKGKATIGYFNADRYGADLMLFRPFKTDERFSLEGRVGIVGIGYWNGFKLHYDTDMNWTWTIGANFYWPRYNTNFCLKGEQYLMGEKGVKFEMTRHYRYASIGFYAMKSKDANSNGGFRFQVLLPPYKHKRHKFIPRVSTSYNIGIAYNAGNEQYYYKQYRSEANENIMNNNSFNPYFIKTEINNNY